MHMNITIITILIIIFIRNLYIPLNTFQLLLLDKLISVQPFQQGGEAPLATLLNNSIYQSI